MELSKGSWPCWQRVYSERGGEYVALSFAKTSSLEPCPQAEKAVKELASRLATFRHWTTVVPRVVAQQYAWPPLITDWGIVNLTAPA